MKNSYPRFFLSVIVTLFITLTIGYFLYGLKIFIPEYNAFNITLLAVSGTFFYFILYYFKGIYGYLFIMLIYVAYMIYIRDLIIFNWIGFLLFFSVNVLAVLSYNKIFKTPKGIFAKMSFLSGVITMLLLYIFFAMLTLAIQYLVVKYLSSAHGNYPISNLYMRWQDGVIKNGIAGLGIGLGIEVSKRMVEELKEKI